MKLPFPQKKENPLDLAIKAGTAALSDMKMGSDEYYNHLDYMSKLYALQETNPSRRVSPDTVITVIGSLIGVLILVGYESEHVVTARTAIPFLPKPKS